MKTKSVILSALILFTIQAGLHAESGSDKKKGSDSDEMRLLVMDLKPLGGIPKDIATTISDWIRVGMVKSKKFTVVDRQSLESVLKEQAFQQSGACTDTACSVKIGQLLAANKMLVGSISKVENKYSVNVQILDVEKSSVDHADNQTADSLVGMEKGVTELCERISLAIGREEKGVKIQLASFVPLYPQFKRGRYISGGVFTIGLLGAAGTYGSSASAYRSAKTNYNSSVTLAFLFSTQPSMSLLYFLQYSIATSDVSNANRLRGQANSALGAMGLLHGLNVMYTVLTAKYFTKHNSMNSEYRAPIFTVRTTGRGEAELAMTFLF